jgi:hypothetical protein
MRKAILIIGLLIIFSMCACTSTQGQNPADAIEITYETGPEIHKTDDLEFWAKNTSTNCVVFPYDYGIKIFREVDGIWVETPNLTEYFPRQDKYLREAKNVFSEELLILMPDLSKIQLQGPTNFRAVLNGHLCNDENVVIEKIVPFTVIP